MVKIERARFLPHLIVLVAVLGTYAHLSQPRQIRGDTESSIPLELPTRLGPYIGEDLLFCQNDQCARVFRRHELGDGDVEGLRCTNCTNEVAAISIGEARMLPSNTPIFRKVYAAPNHPDIQATLVFSGNERMSIHKPQVCLLSQGNRIVNELEYDVRVTPERRMPVRVIELLQDYAGADGEKITEYAVYAYWFFSPERETPSHSKRLLWMAYDNALRSYRPRWAYVSLAMLVDPRQPEAYKAELDDFVPRLYPLTEALRAKLLERDGMATGD